MTVDADSVEIEITVEAVTDRALCVGWVGCPTPYKLPWWPRSQVVRLDGRREFKAYETVRVRIPRWLAQRNGIV